MPYKFNPLTNKFDFYVDLTNVEYIGFDLDAGYEVGTGELAWNADEHTLDLGMDGGVVGQINHETFYPISVNQTGDDIPEGAFVQFAGTLGNSGKILIAPRVSDGSAPVEYSMGVVTQTGGIANGEEGHVTWFGKVRGLDTTGTYLTEADEIAEINFQTWSDGNILYPNPLWDGHFTNIKPAAPNDKSPIAAVIHAHASGTLLVRPHLIPNLNDLGDVNGTSVNTTGQIIVWDQDSRYFDFTHNIENYRYVKYPISMYDALPTRGSETNWHGGLTSLATGQPLDSVPTDLVVTKGIGKIIIVINAGSDLAGDITITGTSVDRNTGATTPADTDTITVDSLTTDNSTTDANGNIVHDFDDAYISSKWFHGTLTLSTSDLTLTDVDIYGISFEQNDDSQNIVLNTFDATILTTNVNAEFDAYLHTVHVTGNKCNIDNESSLHVGTVGMTAIASVHERLRHGNINEPIDGTTDGWWVDVHYSNSPAYVEDVTITIWFTNDQIPTPPSFFLLEDGDFLLFEDSSGVLILG